MRRIFQTILLAIFCLAAESLTLAVCAGTSVNAFGARGDGVTDDTQAIQNAINAAAANGGGSVVFNVARYFTSGSLIVPAGVVLCGALEGPFDDATGVNPGLTTIAPTLLITNTSAPFVTLNGLGAGVTDLLFHYPNQAHASASSPIVYPYTIVANAPGTKVLRSMTTNAYNFLDIESGRVIAENLFIGAYNIGVNVDHAYDHVTLRNLLQTVFWDSWEAPYPSTIDSWVMNHGIALVINRVDSIDVHDFDVFHRSVGMLLTDSPDTRQNPRCGYGSGSDISLDTMQNGIIVKASNAPGYVFTNLVIGSSASGQAAVQVTTGGSSAPEVLVESGSIRGSWSLGPFPTPATGNMTVANIIGFDLP